MIARYSMRNRQHFNSSGSILMKERGNFVNGGPGGQDIIHNDDVFILYLGHIGECESILDGFFSLVGLECMEKRGVDGSCDERG